MSNPDSRIETLPRLLFVVNAAWFFISHRLPLAEAARRAGYDVHIATGAATADEIQLLKIAGFSYHSLGLKRASGNPFHNGALLLQLFSVYRSVRPAIVHHVTIKPVILGTLAARFLRVPAVVNAVSGLGYSFSSTKRRRKSLRSLVGLAYRVCLKHPRMTVIFQNADDRLDFLRWTGIKSLNYVLIAGSGVDINRFHPTPEPNGIVRVVVPARMLRDKGIVEFSMAIGSLRARGVLVEGLLAGSPDPENPESLTVPELRVLEAQYGVRWI
jgi:glycosyltransferase involved in cell wall biosynthesis